MAERIKLDQPVYVDPGWKDFELSQIVLDRHAPAVSVLLTQVDGGVARQDRDARYVEITYTGQEAMTLLKTLNAMDFRTVSLERRVMMYLQQTGKLAGTVTTVPDEGAETKE